MLLGKEGIRDAHPCGKVPITEKRGGKCAQTIQRDHLKRMSSQGSKQFWKSVKFLKKTSIQISTLKKGSDEISSNAGKASLLNEVLSQNFKLFPL